MPPQAADRSWCPKSLEKRLTRNLQSLNDSGGEVEGPPGDFLKNWFYLRNGSRKGWGRGRGGEAAAAPRGTYMGLKPYTPLGGGGWGVSPPTHKCVPLGQREPPEESIPRGLSLARYLAATIFPFRTVTAAYHL